MRFLLSILDSVGNLLQVGWVLLQAFLVIMGLWMGVSLLNPTEEELRQEDIQRRNIEETLREARKPVDMNAFD